jgi:hypothetical protein
MKSLGKNLEKLIRPNHSQEDYNSREDWIKSKLKSIIFIKYILVARSLHI